MITTPSTLCTSDSLVLSSADQFSLKQYGISISMSKWTVTSESSNPLYLFVLQIPSQWRLAEV